MGWRGDDDSVNIFAVQNSPKILVTRRFPFCRSNCFVNPFLKDIANRNDVNIWETAELVQESHAARTDTDEAQSDALVRR
jgi:hypothetical protein